MTTGFYSHTDCLLHDTGAGHPERASRLQAIDDHVIASRIDIALQPETAPLADEPALLRAHSAAHLASIRAAIPSSGCARIDDDTFVSAASWQAALRAAGAAVAATDAVLDGRFDNAFCNIRPPGHHASRDRAMGFCLFNNVAVAALHALEARGIKRVAIVDFDVHHGNGTEAIFANDPRVLMCGIFQHPFYPFAGVPPRAPNVANVPLPARSGGTGLREAVERDWLPRLSAFSPQMIFVSAGFDGHREDDMGNLGLVEDDFDWVTRQIVAVARRDAGGRIVSCLEGGYDGSSLGRSVVAHLRALTEI